MPPGLIVRRLPPRRWRDVPLAHFVTEYGIDELAGDLRVTRQAVQHWLTGRNAPRPMHALRITKIAGGKLSIEDVYVGLDELRKRR